eukprot:COSAG05_NODE_3944_length_1760_cov_19.908015_2_plen_90_part_00
MGRGRRTSSSLSESISTISAPELAFLFFLARFLAFFSFSALALASASSAAVATHHPSGSATHSNHPIHDRIFGTRKAYNRSKGMWHGLS